MPGDDHDALRATLATAVEALGGAERSGQIAMAEAVAEAMSEHEHLLVQAGTGTGKSLGYLVPALRHNKRVVIATATLALQHQLVERDLPRLTKAVSGVAGVDTTYAVLKGRSNYACLHRVREGAPDDQGELIQAEAALGAMGKKVLELREWAEGEVEAGGSGEKDAAPRHTDKEWRQVSVSARECLGRTKCQFGEECFAERAKEKAARSHLVVTNHSLLAIDAIEGIPMIPEYDVVVIDEAHELTARVTQAATDELWASEVERAARRAARHTRTDTDDPAGDLEDAANVLRGAIAEAQPGRFEALPDELADALALVRDAARALASAFPKADAKDEPDAGLTQAKGAVQELFATADRMAANGDYDVLWLTEGTDRLPPRLCIAPLQVWSQLRAKLLADKTVVMTSATLMLGGDFNSIASSVGLKPSERVPHRPLVEVRGAPAPSLETKDTSDALARRVAASASEPRIETPEGANDAEPWIGLDVGSPFDYGKQSILYIARHLPQPGRDGLGPAQLEEITELVDAANGRTLGLFSSRRAAEAAAEHVRTKLPHLTTLAQGDAQLPELARQFVEDPHTNLFGTLGLWQGLDVPGDTCQLVIIDRIPFPRPDDPLMSARQRAADQSGGNGFMQVAATHAALLLAQGAGRLIRTHSDKGLVAVLDPRLVTARYGSFLKASLPPMWTTTDPAVARKALGRLSGSA
ncbi:ATP-dependent DNA helicase [Nocardioides humilatus]|uniref:ATP-dependent helicase DinG n=1 Tax=Nocardioides humilatus TaxID=2607660 RepID=A0A5B1LFM0_9ACTN|nr:ATP-dependent DNA helicase [Nocardioides humilatus]KAA1419226.1 ATP-dependent DNA helicase [Nocardioides humilatus]